MNRRAWVASIYIAVVLLAASPAVRAALPSKPPGSWTGAEWMQLTEEEQRAFLLGAIHMALELSLSFVHDPEQRAALLGEFARWNPDYVAQLSAALNAYIKAHGGDEPLFDLLDACCAELWRTT